MSTTETALGEPSSISQSEEFPGEGTGRPYKASMEGTGVCAGVEFSGLRSGEDRPYKDSIDRAFSGDVLLVTRRLRLRSGEKISS